MKPIQDNERIFVGGEKKIKKTRKVKRELAELLVDDDGCVRRDGHDENG